MREMIGCAGALALIAFVLGLPFTLFITVDHWSQRLFLASTYATITFVATILLCLQDYSSHRKNRAMVRRTLLDRSDTSGDGFVALISNPNANLLLQTRNAIADFFNVPAEKLLPNDDLRTVLRADKLEPSFQLHVVNSVIAKNTDEPQPFMFGLEGLSTIADLSTAIENVLDGFSDS